MHKNKLQTCSREGVLWSSCCKQLNPLVLELEELWMVIEVTVKRTKQRDPNQYR